MTATTPGAAPATAAWREAVAGYRRPRLAASIWQLANTLVPYLALWALMIWSLGVSYWLTLALAVPAAGLLVRVFIIFHDCGHRSFFRSRRANALVEFITGVLTFTPYRDWRHGHAMHHASAGNLDRRGTGDVWTLTVREYLEAPRWKRFVYRAIRNPLVLLTVGPLYLFIIKYRFASRGAGKLERRGVQLTNLALLALLATMSLTVGVRPYLLVMAPVWLLSSAAGVWLFYVQHQFEGTVWRRDATWDFLEAGLQGSSYYRLPGLLEWFTGNIGFHHIHHLSPSIPNYHLARCHRENAVFQDVRPLTLASSMRSLRLHLWDEETGTLVGYDHLRALRHSASPDQRNS